MKLRTEQKIRKLRRNMLALLLSVVIVGTGSGISTLAGSTNFEEKVETEAQKKEAKEEDEKLKKQIENM